MSIEQPILQPETSAKARAARLKRIRNLANLSRKEICKKADININTLTGWELARHGGLTAKGAEKVIALLANEGIKVTLDWLLYEIGAGPRMVSEPISKTKPNPEKIDLNPSDFSKEKELIAQELLLFRSHHKRTFDLIVSDDGMFPYYRIGDYVAGIPFYGKDIYSFVGEVCIIQLENGQTVLRRLKKGAEENTFHLFCVNLETTVPKPILSDIKVKSVSPIIWHRRPIVLPTKSSTSD